MMLSPAPGVCGRNRKPGKSPLKKTPNRTSRLILWGLLPVGVGAIGALFSAMPFLIPSLVNRQELKAAIEKGMHEATGVHAQIRDLSLEMTWIRGIQVHLRRIALTDAHRHPLGTVGDVTVEIRLLPIVLQQLPEIAQIRVRTVRIPVGQYNLFRELRLKPVKPEKMGFLKPAEPKDAEILIRDYQVADQTVDLPWMPVGRPRKGAVSQEAFKQSPGGGLICCHRPSQSTRSVSDRNLSE